MKNYEPFLDPRSENSSFQYCPSFPAALTFTAIFALLLLAHVMQAFQYRKPFAWVICMAAAWETAGFALRSLNVIHQTSLGLSMPSTILILLSPLLINAFDYMVFGRMLYFYTPEKKIAGIRAQRLAAVFVWLDIVYVFCSFLLLVLTLTIFEAHSLHKSLVPPWHPETILRP